MAENKEATYRQLNCPICLETFESPKVLICLHTFCEKCICKHARSLKGEGIHSSTITCPICRNPTLAPAADQTPEEWAAKLGINSIVLSLLASDQPNKDDSVYCQPCLILAKQNISVAYCVTCSEYLCNGCYSCHKSFKVSKDHTITVNSVSVLHSSNSSQDNMYRCSIHWKQFKYYCSNHKELCCSECIIKDHRKCDEVLLIKDLSRSGKEGQDFKQVLEKLETVKTMFITLLESTSKIIDSIEQQKIAITRSIQDWTIKIKEFIDRLETASLQELDQLCKLEKIKVSDEIVACKSAIAAIETSDEMLVSSRKSDNGTKMFITMTKVSRQVQKYWEKYKTMENSTEIVGLDFHFDSFCEGIIQTLSSIGTLTRTVIKIPKLSADLTFAKTKIPTIQQDSMVTFNAKIHDDKNIFNIYSGVFLIDERLVLCDRANNKLKLFDRYFQFVSHLTMENEPRHLCRVDESTVAVTVYKDIKLVSVTNKLTLLRSISVGKQCYGIASYQHNIIVDIGGNSLLTYDPSDEIINRIMSYDSLVWDNTHCVSQDGQRIYYTRRNAVVTMDMKGNKLHKFKSNDLKGASGIIVDKQGIIFCCGTESKTVTMVTSEGRQLGVLLSRDHGLEYPSGICLNNRNDTILVFEEGSNDVKVFKIS
ncbi:hypothetical protein CHS0354_009606 [Potamilus streckersoni]|uniref:RING-type domain-containing protein n=1 Tax=Potamilus streckersoni TaxID=2493646 RepID=A0AAE0SPB2_9BIVA|nr:hypothetical protein CHS0354_009606 [Potamilus streckersoni]